MGTRLNNREIVNLTRELSKEIYNTEFIYPITVSARMTNTLGYFQYRRMKGQILPTKIQFSAFLIDGRHNLSTIKSVIKHELAHWYLAITGQRFSDGDYVFEKEIKRIGASSTNTIQSCGTMHTAVCSKCGSVRYRNYSETRAKNYGKNRTSGCCGARIVYGGTIIIEDENKLVDTTEKVVKKHIEKKEEPVLKVATIEATTKPTIKNKLSISDIITPGPKGITNVQINPVIRKAVEENSKEIISLLISNYPDVYYSAKKYFGKIIKSKLDKLEVS